jgi:hypothetical protein
MYLSKPLEGQYPPQFDRYLVLVQEGDIVQMLQ